MENKMKTGGGEVQVVAFTIDDQEYAINILDVQEIIRILPITRVPKAPAYLEGVINLRGNVIPVIDVRKRFNLTPWNETESSRIIIVRSDDITTGLIVDRVSEVIRLSETDFEKAPDITGSQDLVVSVGKVGERLLLFLNLAEVLELNRLLTKEL